MSQAVFNLLETTKTNFSIEKIQYPAPEGYGQPDSYGLYNSQDKGGKPLATVGNRYHVLQNKDLASAFLQACDQVGLQGTKKGGTWARGKYIFYQVTLSPETIGKDTLKRHLTAINSHGDGSCAIGMSNVVQSCANQFHKISKGLSKIRHTSSIQRLVTQQASSLNKILLEEQEVLRILREAADTPVEKEDVYALGADLMGVSIPDYEKVAHALSKGIVRGLEIENLSTRKRNMVAELQNALNYEMKDSRKGSNLFGLFNGVTYYTNHVAKKQDVGYLMNGGGYKMNNQAFSYIEDLVLA